MMKYFLNIGFVFFTISATAQIKQGEANVSKTQDIQEESVTVERIYEPNVESAQKIKQSPRMIKGETEKLPINLIAKDTEVPSGFQPEPLLPQKLDLVGNEVYNNYVNAAYGNQNNINLNAFVIYPLMSDLEVGADVSYRSANPSFTTAAKNKYANLRAEGFLNYLTSGAKYTLKAGGTHKQLNWYGIPQQITEIVPSIPDVSQHFTQLFLKGSYQGLQQNILDNAKVEVGYLTDAYAAKEISLLSGVNIKTADLYEVDYLGGFYAGLNADINLNYWDTHFEARSLEPREYQFFQPGIQPYLRLKGEWFNAEIGANAQYLSRKNKGESSSKIFLFPRISLELKTFPEFIVFGGVRGGVEVNTYQSLSDFNPYVYANQALKPSIHKLDLYAGIKGDIQEIGSYSIEAGHETVDNLLYFKRKPVFTNYFTATDTDLLPDAYVNTFHAEYEDGTRTYLNAQVILNNIWEDLNIEGFAKFQSFNIEEAYEMPGLEMGAGVKYSWFKNQLVTGGDVFFVGNRKGLTYIDHKMQPVTLSPYMDVNLNAQYLINSHWSVKAELFNLLNKNYQRFTDYKTQGFTVIGGLQYKF